MFDNDEENEAEAVEADPPQVEDPLTDGDPGDAEVSEASEGDLRGSPPVDDGGDDGDAPGDDVDVEEALKELSARMSRISSNLEGVERSRGQLESQLGNVEERLSHLGSLAEAVSSEYNPFISENAPSQPSWSGEGEPPEAGDPPASDFPPEPDAPGQDGGQPGEPSPPPDETPERSPAPGDADEQGGIPSADPRSFERGETEGQPERARDPHPERGRGRPERRKEDGLEENMILLEWVGMMLDRVGRAGLMDLLDYYQNLGWLDRETKDQATRVAVGVDAPDTVGDGQWRGDLDLHRRSLVAIQRLRGDEIPAARLDELELDLRRLFRE